MSPSPDDDGQSAKPGTACLCCRRRKLKCSREALGCDNCKKIDLPCIYPAPDTGVKRKRGPYRKKDKPAREAHLEHVVKYLSNPVSAQRAQTQHDSSRQTSASPPPRSFDMESTALRKLAAVEPERASEDLVRDALIALTSTTVTDHNAAESRSASHAPPQSSKPQKLLLLDMWQIFLTRVDPLTKLIHSPSFAPKVYAALDQTPSGSTGMLLSSVCFAAVNSCNNTECLSLLGRGKAQLLQQYKDILEETIVRSLAIPDLEFMQALVLFLLCLCREDSSELWALFSLTVRNAQLMGLDAEPATTIRPHEAELRRRLWWTICSLEIRCSEEGIDRTTALLATNKVAMPLNFEDWDLSPTTTEMPEPRSGITTMSFVLVRWEIMQSNVKLWAMSKKHDTDIRAQMQTDFDELGTRLDKKYLQHCHISRPYDWLLITIADVMMIKCCLTIQHPSNQLIDETLPPAQRLEILRLSVLVIRTGYKLLSNPRCPEFLWYFRSYLQWHSISIVLAELSHNTDAHFVETAWTVLEPFMQIWDRVYKNKKQDSTWNYVNLLIEKARTSAKARQVEQKAADNKPASSCTGGILPFAAFEPTTHYHLVDFAGRSTQQHDVIKKDLQDYTMNMTTTAMDVDFSIDFEALDSVFSSTNWGNAIDMQFA